MDDNRPVTHSELKTELAALEVRVEGRFTDLEARLTDNLTEKMRQIETNMLTAFHSYARAENTRMHTSEVIQEDFRMRLSSLEERVLNLETNRPPN